MTSLKPISSLSTSFPRGVALPARPWHPQHRPAEIRLYFGQERPKWHREFLNRAWFWLPCRSSWKQAVADTVARYETSQRTIPSASPASKKDRLQAVLWVLEHLPQAASLAEIKSYVALAVKYVEQRAFSHSRGTRPLDSRMVVYVSMEPAAAPGVQVMFSKRHAIIMASNGALQIQNLPLGVTNPYEINYRNQAFSQPNAVIVDKPGTDGKDAWGRTISSCAATV